MVCAVASLDGLRALDVPLVDVLCRHDLEELRLVSVTISPSLRLREEDSRLMWRELAPSFPRTSNGGEPLSLLITKKTSIALGS